MKRRVVRTQTTRVKKAMSDTDYDIYDDMAEAWEGTGRGSGGGGAKKIKAKARPSQVGRVRVGGNAWGTTEKKCAKGCAMKCCSSSIPAAR